MQYVARFCSACQRDTMCQVHNNGYVRCLTHEPLEPTTEQLVNFRDEEAYLARRVKN